MEEVVVMIHNDAQEVAKLEDAKDGPRLNSRLNRVEIGLLVGAMIVGGGALASRTVLGSRDDGVFQRLSLQGPNFESPVVSVQALNDALGAQPLNGRVPVVVDGVTSLSETFQVFGRLTLVKKVSFESGGSKPDFHVYSFDQADGEVGYRRSVCVLIEPGNDPIAKVGENANVHLVGRAPKVHPSKGGPFFNEKAGTAQGLVDGPIIVVDYLKIVPDSLIGSPKTPRLE
jgi:hypothetical protein